MRPTGARREQNGGARWMKDYIPRVDIPAKLCLSDVMEDILRPCRVVPGDVARGQVEEDQSLSGLVLP